MNIVSSGLSYIYTITNLLISIAKFVYNFDRLLNWVCCHICVGSNCLCRSCGWRQWCKRIPSFSNRIGDHHRTSICCKYYWTEPWLHIIYVFIHTTNYIVTYMIHFRVPTQVLVWIQLGALGRQSLLGNSKIIGYFLS